jgi:molybdopterin-guanine dinucleotide biosynthesis protein A
MSDVLLKTTLAVLAGGEGSRMGRPKGSLTIAGRPILRYILEMAQWSGPTLLITSPGRESPPGADAFDAEATDPVAGLGPLRGVLTALEHSSTEHMIVSAVDMPALNGEIFGWLAAALHRRPSALAVMVERRQQHRLIMEPLPAAFRYGARSLLQRRLATGRTSLHQLRECDNVEIVRAPRHWPPALWANLNLPDDLAQWESRIHAE